MIGQVIHTGLPMGVASCEEWVARLLDRGEPLGFPATTHPCYLVLATEAARRPLPVAIPEAPGAWYVLWQDPLGELREATGVVARSAPEAIRRAAEGAGRVAGEAVGGVLTGLWADPMVRLGLLVGGGLLLLGVAVWAFGGQR